MRLDKSIEHRHGLSCAIAPVPNQGIKRDASTSWKRATSIQCHLFPDAQPHGSGISGQRSRTRNRNGCVGISAWGFASHLRHPALVARKGPAVDHKFNGDAACWIDIRGCDGHIRKRVVFSCADERRGGVVSVIDVQNIVVCCSNARFQTEDQKRQGQRFSRRVWTKRDGVVLVGIRLLKARAPRIVIGEENGVNVPAIHSHRPSV